MYCACIYIYIYVHICMKAFMYAGWVFMSSHIIYTHHGVHGWQSQAPLVCMQFCLQYYKVMTGTLHTGKGCILQATRDLMEGFLLQCTKNIKKRIEAPTPWHHGCWTSAPLVRFVLSLPCGCCFRCSCFSCHLSLSFLLLMAVTVAHRWSSLCLCLGCGGGGCSRRSSSSHY